MGHLHIAHRNVKLTLFFKNVLYQNLMHNCTGSEKSEMMFLIVDGQAIVHPSYNAEYQLLKKYRKKMRYI